LPTFSLRSHLALVVLGTVLPGALLTGIIVWRTLENNRGVIERRLSDAARVDAEALDREFNGTIRVLETLAQSPALDRGDLVAFRDEAVRSVGVQKGWNAIILFTPDGQQLVHTLTPPGAALRRATEWNSLRQVVESGRPGVGALTASPRDQKLRFPIRVPVARDGHLRFVLTAVMEPESLTPLVQSHLPETEEWTRAIVDPAFRIAARSRGGDRYVGRPVSPEALNLVRNPPASPAAGTSIEGEALYSALRRSTYGWTSSVSVPAIVLDGPARASVRAIVAGGAVLLVGGLVSVLFVSRRVARDFAAARDAAAALADGQAPPPSRPRVAEGRQVQESLLRAARLLQERARERDEQLQRAVAAQAQAEEISRTKDQFLAVLGHELRNPLAPALTALELMKRRAGTTLQREREVLERQISHMTRLVDDLLDVSRLTRGKVELMRRRVDIQGLVDRAVDMARPLITQQGHQLTIDIAATGLAVDADEDRLLQALINLLSNAAKYTPPGGHIRISATGIDHTIELACQDNGPGISPELVPAMFEPFAQGPRAIDRQQGGLGLGLALARSLTELHGGTLTFETVTPHGSRFVMRLPRASALPAPSPDSGDLPRGMATSRRILLVEDNDDARAMMQMALEAAGHAVETARDGVSAVAVAAAFAPEVAILDIGLPGMNGYDLARMLRGRYPALRLIALTGYGQDGDVQAADDAGFNAHCTKPITIDELLSEIESTTRSARL
jgi:signal transduction histidine kinase/CheY-like chemotaxis protein